MIETLIDVEIFEDSLDLWGSLGIHSPVLQGSVPISRIYDSCLSQLKRLDQIPDSAQLFLAKAFLYERLCRYDLSLHYAKQAVNTANDFDIDSKLFLCKSYFYSGSIPQASFLLSEINIDVSSRLYPAFLFWHAKIVGFESLVNFEGSLDTSTRLIPETVIPLVESNLIPNLDEFLLYQK